jgi:tRNA-dihydrouridine synthase A
LQLGGAEPRELAASARIGADLGYAEINLNVGCPSDRVQKGTFGACLMREPALVAECVAAMRAAARIPVTVKCRIGVDDQDPENALPALIDACVAAGVTTFAVHARKAWLHGLSPKDNREIPPLDYGIVYALKRARPELTIVVNGGIASLDEAEAHLAHVDGVMLGRAAYQTPWVLANVDQRFFRESVSNRTQQDIIAEFRPYIAARLSEGVPLAAMTRHILGLFHGQPGARLFRRHLAENAHKRGAGLEVVDSAMALLETAARQLTPA